MKFVLFAMLMSTLSAQTFASPAMTCSGKALISNPWIPLPILRDMTVEIDQALDGNGVLTVDIGGRPISYEGVLVLDGSSEMVIIKDNGDVIRLYAKLSRNNKKMKFKIRFGAEDNELGGTNLTSLRCQ